MATIYSLGGEGIAISRRTNRASRSNRININRNIRAKEVRVIDPDGNQIGIIPTYKAIAVANDFGLDLVEISPNADPPVCKIMDYGRYKYELTKKKQEAKKKQTAKPKAKKHRKLTSAESERYRQLLLEKWAELLGDVNHIEEEALRTSRLDAAGDLSSMPIHMADMGTDNFEQEFAIGLMDSERKILAKIRDALQRIDQGTFGICEGTGKPIAKARLNAKPWARYCIEYARMVEQGLIREGEKVPAEEQEGEADVEDSQENRDDTEYEAQDDDDGSLKE